jgi:phosphatidylinositol glycan class M
MNIGSSSFFGASGRGGALLAAVGDSGWAFAAAQAAAQATLGWRLAADPAAALLAQTVAFVALNRVATAQYFVWWLAFLPLLLPELAARLDVRRARALGGAAAAWAAAVGHWLAWAYALEFRGAPVHAGVWAAALLLLGASAALLRALLAALGAGGAAKAKATRR